MEDLRQQEENKKSFYNTLLVAVCILLCAVIVKAFILTNFIAIGDSMFPTYHDGEVVWVYRTTAPKRGDVVVLHDDNADIVLIKRVVATKGDRLRAVIDDKGKYYFEVLYSDSNQWVKESYKGVDIPTVDYFALGNPATRGQLIYKHSSNELQDGLLIVDDYFVMGDNRTISSDSRTRGAFSSAVIIGMVFAP